MRSKRDKRTYIIKKRIGWAIKIRDLLLTLLLWGLWIYLLYPLAALLMWKLFSIDLFFYYDSPQQIAKLQRQLVHFAIIGGIIVLCVTLCVVGWGVYNQKKFSRFKNKRRKMPRPIDSATMAASLQVRKEMIDTVKEAHYIQIYHTHTPPKPGENPFKKLPNASYKRVNILFSDDWEAIRRRSNFGYTHRQQNAPQFSKGEKRKK